MIESMLHKVTEYFILSLASFCLFSALFRTVAYAQTVQQIKPPLPSTQHATDSNNNLQPSTSPTPTLFIQPTQTTQTTTSPTPSTTPAPEAKASPAPTVEPTSILTPTPTTAASIKTKITTTPTPILVTKTVVTQPPAAPSGIDAEKLFSMVNTYRQGKGLPAFQKDDRVCSLANARATEIAGEMAAGTLHSGMYARNLPYWNTENAIAYSSEEADMNWWLDDSIHRQAIESNKIYSCTACSGNYCVQEFTNFQPK